MEVESPGVCSRDRLAKLFLFTWFAVPLVVIFSLYSSYLSSLLS